MENNQKKTNSENLRNKTGYGNRNLKLEWRHKWFTQDRLINDAELWRHFKDAYTEKQIRIDRQIKDKDLPMAGYSPAGPGTPWFSIGPRNVNGRVKSIAVHPTNENILYAGAASGGVWKSSNGGQSWYPLWDMQESLAIGSIAIAPGSPNTLYVGTGEWTPGWSPSYPGSGVYKSINAGDTWTLHNTNVNRRVSKVLVSPTDANTVYVAGESGFEKSINGGTSWTTIHAGQISDAVIDPLNSDTVYINVNGDRIYKTTDGGTLWTPLDAGPTGGNAGWIKLAIGTSGTHTSDFIVAKSNGGSTIYTSIDGGTTWTTLSGSHGGASFFSWCSLLGLAPDDENIIIAGGVGIERTSNGGTSWNNIGGLHSDHHQCVFAPSNTNIAYSCNDGGVYRSNDKGATFKKVSHGLIVTQFYDLGTWNTISNVLGGGTQDNGTNMTTGGLTWKNIFGWDGGYFVMHPTDPRTIYAEHQNTDIYKSTDGGGSWTQKTGGLSGGTPWTGVICMDLNNPNTLFVGTTRVFRTTDGAATDWVISSQVLAGTVTTIEIALSDSNRVYTGAGTKIYRSDDGGATSPWADKSTGLPTRAIKDIAIDRTNADRVAICFSGINAMGTPNGIYISTTGGDSWTDISGNSPNISINAIALDPNDANTVYIGTDAGVYRTTNLGGSWDVFDNGIPNVIITDLHIDAAGNMIYASTMGRGMYKLDIAPGASEPSVDLYLRDSLLDVGERFPSPSGYGNPNDITDNVYWWESPDIKVDVMPFYTPDAIFDGVEFDEDVNHEDPERTESNRFYLQVHNRGYQQATNVSVRAFFADASAGLPNLPNALVAPNFTLTDEGMASAPWKPIGAAQTIPLLEPNRPVIVHWDWIVPASSATHSCLMAVTSSAEDPMTNTETVVGNLIPNEKKVCLKNLHVINSSSPAASEMLSINFHNHKNEVAYIDMLWDPIYFSEGKVGIMFEKLEFKDENNALVGVNVYNADENEYLGKWYRRRGSRAEINFDELYNKIDKSKIYELSASKKCEINGIKMKPNQTLHAVVICKGSKNVPYGKNQQFAIMQRMDGKIQGGSTYEIRLPRASGLFPINRIRIILEKVKILNDLDPWIKGKGEIDFTTCVSFNDEPGRKHYRRLPLKGQYRISDKPSKNEIIVNECIFDGYVGEKDNMNFSILPIERDWLDCDDNFALYSRQFNFPAANWVGKYQPKDEPDAVDKEKMSDWMVWYRIETVKIKI